ncbi:hypothetical protein ACFLW1_03055 [Chloroflexota bacterium]
MGFVRGLIVSVLSLLLFASLAVFGVLFTAQSTILNPDFVTREVDNIDLAALVREMSEGQIDEYLPADLDFLKGSIYDVITDMEPALKAQVNSAIRDLYDYLLGETEHLSITVSLEQFREDLRDSMWLAFQDSLPAELVGLAPAEIQRTFNEYFDEFVEQGLVEFLPASFVFTESDIPADVMGYLADARQYLGYLQTAYWALIAFMVLLAALIFVTERDIRKISRSLGITLLLYGVIEYAGAYFTRQMIPSWIPVDEIPASLQTWVLGIATDMLQPVEILAIGVAVAGAALLIVSFVYKPRAREE